MGICIQCVSELSKIYFGTREDIQLIVSEIINIKNNVTVKDVADHFGYNPDYIGKLFKEYFHTGLKSYIAAERIKLAKDMLFTTNMTVMRISSELGFSSENNFIKFFSYHEHISPAKFRDRCGNTHINNI